MIRKLAVYTKGYRIWILLGVACSVAEAVLELLQQSENYRSSGGVQLELRWRDGQWRIAPTERLLQMLTGGLSTTERGGEA